MQWSRVLGNLEKQIFIPLSAVLKPLPTFCAWNGQDRVDQVVTHLMRCASGPILSLDFSGFDASVPFEVIGRVFSIIQHWFDESARSHINFVHSAFIRSGLFTPVRMIQPGERLRGVPSGSVLTNLIDSLVNLWVMAYVAALDGGTVELALVQGDDGVYTFRNIISFQSLSNRLQSELGMTIKMDPTKNLVSLKEVMFLQNHHRSDYVVRGMFVGVRPINRATCNMLNHERAPAQKKAWLSEYNTYRWLQQANNCFRHRRFREYCAWLWKNDDYLQTALGKILRHDTEVIIANDLLDVGQGERGKIPVSMLESSPVIRELYQLARSLRVSL